MRPVRLLNTAPARVTGGPAHRNTKLARTATRQVLIETRGEGGFTVLAPSTGPTHPSGAPWVTLAGGPDTCPVLTVDERDALYMLAAMLDQTPADEPTPASDPTNGRPRMPGDPLRPGDDYNQRATWEEILTPHGWTASKRLGDRTIGWTRPRKNPAHGISATTGRNDSDNLYVFTTSTVFEAEKPYSKFGAYALLHHGGDYTAAARALAGQGYGEPLTPPERIDPRSLIPGAPPARHLAAVPAIDGTAALQHDHVTVSEQAAAGQIAAAYGATEDGTARALIDLHGDTLRYCPQRGSWLVWNGARWTWDEAKTHREHVRHIARNLPEHDGWKAYKRRALSASGVDGIIRLAQTDPRTVVHINELDARPYELNTPGGIINLRTGTLRPADPHALHTRSTAVVPDYDHPAPIWHDFLTQTTGGDPNLENYLQRLLGLAAIGTVLEQILPFAYGPGANGKSTLIEAGMSALGRGHTGYSIAADPGMLMMRRHQEHPAEIAQLAGARLVVCSELEDGQRFAEARVKQLTGRDSVSARFMRQDPFTFTPTHTIVLLGNHKPAVSAGGPALWRRLHLIPFLSTVPPERRDPQLGEKLEAEAPAILAWIARGAADYMAGGMRIPAAVITATEEYAADQDSLGRFIDECCYIDPAKITKTPVSDVRSYYDTWCSETGEKEMTARRFTQELRDRFGVDSIKSNGARKFVGLSLIDGSDTEEPSRRSDPVGGWYR